MNAQVPAIEHTERSSPHPHVPQEALYTPGENGQEGPLQSAATIAIKKHAHNKKISGIIARLYTDIGFIIPFLLSKLPGGFKTFPQKGQELIGNRVSMI